jgi:hypothetical protein
MFSVFFGFFPLQHFAGFAVSCSLAPPGIGAGHEVPVSTLFLDDNWFHGQKETAQASEGLDGMQARAKKERISRFQARSGCRERQEEPGFWFISRSKSANGRH